MEAGLVDLQSVSAASEHRHGARASGLAKPLASDAGGQCRVEWQNVIGGSWMRGYGKTWSGNSYDNSVWVRFYRDGDEVGNEANSNYGVIVEKATPWIWKCACEAHNWTTQTLHNSRDPYTGIYHLGPDAGCFVSKTY